MKCLWCNKRVYDNPKQAIVSQIEFNLSLLIFKPFIIYQCCDKWLVSFSALQYYEEFSNMSEQQNIWDFDLDNPGTSTDDKPNYIHFCKVRFFPGLPIQRFVKGGKLTFPGLFKTDWNLSPPQLTTDPLYFPAAEMKPGASDKLFWFVCEEDNQEGKPIHVVHRFHSWNEQVREITKDEAGNNVIGDDGYPVREYITDDEGKRIYERNAYFDHQLAELQKLPKADYEKLKMTGQVGWQSPDAPNAWAYIRYLAAETGYTKGGEIRTYLKDIVVYANREEWLKAREEELPASTDNGVLQTPVPVAWQSTPQALIDTIKALSQNQSMADVAKSAGLVGAKDANGNDVNAVALLAEILDVPEANIIL